ncbi:BnaAnng02680D [Brassica napus]|uniref:BnaAnng02680D protein n=1 Tax=Brassica napus TaxID=3708 RepID=A0A078G2B7_BRANA|nr:BnaAnng02680D [Brassica napus]
MDAELESFPAVHPSLQYPLTIVIRVAGKKVYLEVPSVVFDAKPLAISDSEFLKYFKDSKVHFINAQGQIDNLAMSGEITPTGEILQIGHVKDKTMGARRSQLKTIIYPEANRREFDELPENLKDGLDVHFVDEYEQIFELAFN